MLGYEPTNPVWVEETPWAEERSGCGCGATAGKALSKPEEFEVLDKPKFSSSASTSTGSEEKERPQGSPATEGWLVPPSRWASYCFSNSPLPAAACPPMAEDPVTVYGFFNDPAFRSAMLITITGATADEEALIRKAYGVLMATDDLIEAALCWAYGGLPPVAALECLRRQLREQSTSFEVLGLLGIECTWDLGVVKSSFEGYASVPKSVIRFGGPGRIAICRSEDWYALVGGWQSGRDEDKMCAALDLAGTILHEVLHTCADADDRVDGSGDACGLCSPTYLMENTWRWAAFQRFSAALNSACCAQYRKEIEAVPSGFRLFMSDCSRGASDAC